MAKFKLKNRDEVLYEGDARSHVIPNNKSFKEYNLKLIENGELADSLDYSTIKRKKTVPQSRVKHLLAKTDERLKWIIQTLPEHTGRDIVDFDGGKATSLWTKNEQAVAVKQTVDETPITEDTIFEVKFYIDGLKELEKIKQINFHVANNTDYKNFGNLILEKHKLKPGSNTIRFVKESFVNNGGSLEFTTIKSVQVRVTPSSDAGAEIKLQSFNIVEVDEPAHVVFTFDDGWLNQYSVAYPMLAEKDLVGDVAIISSYIKEGNPKYAVLENLKDMKRDGWRIMNHTDTHRPLATLSKEEQRKEIMTCYNYGKEQGLSDMNSIAYPFGSYNDDTLDILKEEGIKSARSLIEGSNYEGFEGNYTLKTVNLYNTVTAEAALRELKIAVKTGGVIIFLIHLLVDEPKVDTEFSIPSFIRLLDEIDKNIKEGKLVNSVFDEFL